MARKHDFLGNHGETMGTVLVVFLGIGVTTIVLFVRKDKHLEELG
jgi:glycerol uptake facilitator-like aquaporin